MASSRAVRRVLFAQGPVRSRFSDRPRAVASKPLSSSRARRRAMRSSDLDGSQGAAQVLREKVRVASLAEDAPSQLARTSNYCELRAPGASSLRMPTGARPLQSCFVALAPNVERLVVQFASQLRDLFRARFRGAQVLAEPPHAASGSLTKWAGIAARPALRRRRPVAATACSSFSDDSIFAGAGQRAQDEDVVSGAAVATEARRASNASAADFHCPPFTCARATGRHRV